MYRDDGIDWKFQNGSSLKFTHLQHERDLPNFQGSQIDVLGIDELSTFTEKMFWTLIGCLRVSSNKQNLIRPYLRATCNPEPEIVGYQACLVRIGTKTMGLFLKKEQELRGTLLDI